MAEGTSLGEYSVVGNVGSQITTRKIARIFLANHPNTCASIVIWRLTTMVTTASSVVILPKGRQRKVQVGVMPQKTK